MPISLTSPNVDNYYVGKGILSVKFAAFSAPGGSPIDNADSDYVDMGNVTSLEFTPKVTKLDHYSSRTGTKKKDRTVATVLEAELKLVAEEWTARNLQMALLATLTDSGGVINLDILQEPLKACAIKFVGTNDVGPQWSFEFPICRLMPSAALNPISDEWGKIELTADVLADPTTGHFGTASATFPTSP
jgi:hypothetical protein